MLAIKAMGRRTFLSIGTLRKTLIASVAGVALGITVSALADLVNGGFETGDLTGWTVTTYLNNSGVTLASNPAETQRTGLNLAVGGVDQTSVPNPNSTPESQFDPQLGSSASLRYPKFGRNAAVVNYYLTSSKNVNSLKQSFPITTADVDPADNKPHVRFVVAPVLDNPSHSANQQPYYFVNVVNTTTSTVLFSTFKYANQPGVPWKAGPGTYQYTDWQLVDVNPLPGTLSVGDTVEVEVIASRCQQNGHAGYVYVDGVSSFLPGLYVVASGPTAANKNSDVTYTYTYRNGDTRTIDNATIEIVLPTDNAGTPIETTFVSINGNGASCTTPTVGSPGTVICNVGTLNKNATGTIQVTVNVPNTASGRIGHGNYSIHSDQTTALLGPLVETSVTTGALYADLETSITNNVAALAWGQNVQYFLSVTNNGPSGATGATVDYAVPAQLTGVTWTCSGTGGATCTSSGSGSINDVADIPVGGSLLYTISGNVISGSGTANVVNSATVTAPGGVTDNIPSNNIAVDNDQIGTLRSLTVTKNAASGGTITSSPAAISCGTACASENADFLDGSLVTLNVVAAPNMVFAGWSGGGCSGTGSCTVTMSAATSVTATFDCATAGYFGASCTSQCPGSGTCSGNGTCSSGPAGTGACTCNSGFGGADCLLPATPTPVATSTPVPPASTPTPIPTSVISGHLGGPVTGGGTSPFSGLTVQLINNQGQVIGTTVIDSSGGFSFPGVPSGDTYRLGFLLPPGYVFSGLSDSGLAIDPLTGISAPFTPGTNGGTNFSVNPVVTYDCTATSLSTANVAMDSTLGVLAREARAAISARKAGGTSRGSCSRYSKSKASRLAAETTTRFNTGWTDIWSYPEFQTTHTCNTQAASCRNIDSTAHINGIKTHAARLTKIATNALRGCSGARFTTRHKQLNKAKKTFKTAVASFPTNYLYCPADF